MSCCSCNNFPKFQKKLGPSFLLSIFASSLIWSENFSKELLMFESGLSPVQFLSSAEKFTFLSSLIVIFDYLWSHFESEVCSIEFPAVAEVFALSFSAIVGDFWFCVGRYDYFLVRRCGRYLHLLSAVAEEFEILVFVSFPINVF